MVYKPFLNTSLIVPGSKDPWKGTSLSHWSSGAMPKTPTKPAPVAQVANTAPRTTTVSAPRAAAPTNTGGGQAAGGGYNGGYSAPSAPSAASIAAAKAAAAEAERVAKVRQYKGEVSSKLDAYNNMFGGLYGRINAAGADQANKTRASYGAQRQSLTEDYNQETPQIDMSYYLSGAGDSSFKLGGLGKAEQAFTGSLGKVKQAEDTDLAAIGKEIAGTTGKYQAQQRAIQNVRKQASESDDPAELKRLIADVTNNMLGIDADNAQFDTEAGFRGQVNRVSQVDDVAPVRENLKSLMNGAANPALKKQIAEQLINNAQASDKTKKDLFQEFVSGKV